MPRPLHRKPAYTKKELHDRSGKIEQKMRIRRKERYEVRNKPDAYSRSPQDNADQVSGHEHESGKNVPD